MATNDITGDALRTKATSDSYRDGFDRIFGKGKQMDECDKASEYEQKWIEAQISEHSYQLNHAVNAYPVGECRNCATRLDDGRAYCDETCRDDHWERIKAEKRNGKYKGG